MHRPSETSNQLSPKTSQLAELIRRSLSKRVSLALAKFVSDYKISKSFDVSSRVLLQTMSDDANRAMDELLPIYSAAGDLDSVAVVTSSRKVIRSAVGDDSRISADLEAAGLPSGFLDVYVGSIWRDLSLRLELIEIERLKEARLLPRSPKAEKRNGDRELAATPIQSVTPDEFSVGIGGWAEERLKEAQSFARLVRSGKPPNSLRDRFSVLFSEVIDKLTEASRKSLFEACQRKGMTVPELMSYIADVKQLEASTLLDYRKKFRNVMGQSRKRRPRTLDH